MSRVADWKKRLAVEKRATCIVYIAVRCHAGIRFYVILAACIYIYACIAAPPRFRGKIFMLASLFFCSPRSRGSAAQATCFLAAFGRGIMINNLRNNHEEYFSRSFKSMLWIERKNEHNILMYDTRDPS